MSRMKLKSPKKKRKSNIIIYSLIIYSFFSFTFYSCLKDNKGINNDIYSYHSEFISEKGTESVLGKIIKSKKY